MFHSYVVYVIGICLGMSAILEAMSYDLQAKKTKICHNSENVSSSSYFTKLYKYLFSIVALVLSKNWVGLSMEVWSLFMCLRTTIYIIKNKPEDWNWRNK